MALYTAKLAGEPGACQRWESESICTREGLDVDTPLGRVEAEHLEGALLAQALALVDELVAAVVSERAR